MPCSVLTKVLDPQSPRLILRPGLRVAGGASVPRQPKPPTSSWCSASCHQEDVLPFSRAARAARGLILFDGPSLIDEAPIVVIATGIFTPSTNKKTGFMVQTWILRSDMPPLEASKSGADASICGACPLRLHSPHGVRRCYVVLHEAPSTVFRAYAAGRYAHAEPCDLEELKLLPVRAGSYGDPGAVPLDVWTSILGPSHTGYTHRWRQRPDLKPLMMASVDSAAEHHQAQAEGWRTYRVLDEHEPAPRPNEVMCAHYTRGAQCEYCKLCQGSEAAARASVVTTPSGTRRKTFTLPVVPA